VKLPYIKDRIDFSKTKMVNPNGMYNLIYGINKKDITTYFYIQNSVLYYHRKISRPPQMLWFKPDLKRYELIEFSRLNHNIRGSENLLIKTKEGKLYIISDGVDYDNKKNCLALIDVSTGKNLFIDSQDDNVMLKLLPPIADSIFPILQVTNHEIFVHLFDLSNNEQGVVNWTVYEDIKPILLRLMELMFDTKYFLDLKTDTSILLIEKCELIHIDFYMGSESYANGIRNVSVVLSLTLLGEKYKYAMKNLCIHMSSKSNVINFYISVEKAFFEFFNSKESEISLYRGIFSSYLRSLLKFSPKDYQLNKKILGTYISRVIYKDKCLYILQSNEKIKIFQNTNFLHINQEFSASVYTYGEYLIIISDSGYNDVKLIVLYPNNRSVGIWKIEGNTWVCAANKAVYNYHYDTLHNRLIFVSSDLECLFFIEVEKIEKTIKMKGVSECANEKNGGINELGKAFNLRELAISAIHEWYKSLNNSNKAKNEMNEYDITILGYYINNSFNKIYIMAKYRLHNVEYIVLFMSPLGERMRFNLLGLVMDKSIYVLSYSNSVSNDIHIRPNYLSKSRIFRLGQNVLRDLDLCYDDNNSFISVIYNRISNKIVSLNNRYKVKIDLSWNIGSVMVVMYECRDLPQSYILSYTDIDHKSYCNNAYSFVLADLNLVHKMPVVKV
jgi:hypothetical protein